MYTMLSLCIAWILPVKGVSQPVLFGPQTPPPKGASITSTAAPNSGAIGMPGGITFTMTNISLANTTTVYWTMIGGEIMLSLDNDTYTGDEILTLDPGETSLQDGRVVWTGQTPIPIADESGSGIDHYDNLLSKCVIRVVDNVNTPVALVSPGTAGLPAETGGAVLVTGSSMVFKVTMQMLVSDDGGSTWTPHLTYYNAAQTPDGAETAYSSVNYGFYWENDPPELIKNLPGNVDEGDTLIITPATLLAEDVESTDNEIQFTFNPEGAGQFPLHGALYKQTELLGATDVFTMADITLDDISYVHDGSESVKDSIPLMIKDGDGATYYMAFLDSVFYYHINITPVDDPPVLEINTGGSVDEEGVLVIDQTMLLTSDAESDADHITYTIDPGGTSDFPENGLLKLNGIPLGDGGTFTQSDIGAGKLTYGHDGSSTLSDGFVFKVADEYGHFAEVEGNDQFFFEITINPVNDPPKLINLKTLSIDEGATGIITNSLLAAEDEDHGATEILFTLDPDGEILDPLHGVVKLDGQELGDGDSFTMQDLNNSLVTYAHDGSEAETDFFGFRISDTEGGIYYDGEFSVFHFNISITNVNDVPLVANPIPDQEGKVGDPFDYTFPENTFSDDDTDDELSYEAFTIGDAVLPAWLTFNDATRNFSGTPSDDDVGEVLIIVVASDLDLAEARDTFGIEISPGVNVEHHKCNGFALYPNPFSTAFTIEMSSGQSPETKITVMNILGERITEINTAESDRIRVDLGDKPSGVYFVRIHRQGQQKTYRLIKEQ